MSYHHLPLILLPTISACLLYTFLRPRNQHSIRSVAVLVLGDIGRSPRMMYHAQSFAEHDFATDIIAYGGSKPTPALERLPKVQIHYLHEPPKILGLLPFILFAPIKVFHQVASVLYALLAQLPNAPEFILVQNPPTIPTLAVVWLVGWMRGSKVIIDWHNLGYTILALKVGEKHPFVKIAAWFERTFGRSAYAHLFVTRAMRDFLVEKWDLQGHKIILHDRPPSHFHRAGYQETHELFLKYEPLLSLQPRMAGFLPKTTEPYSTILTQTITKPLVHKTTPTYTPASSLPSVCTYAELPPPRLRPDRPALLVSSTSWTPDEDFGILLDALKVYEARASELAAGGGEEILPKLLVMVTGKGPLQSQYMEDVRRLHESWKWVRLVSLWLKAEDYPILLGSADLGVCMHSSSSALDLPMKVVDMFGCRLPVCALDFACLDELVKDGINGLVFKDSAQLAGQLEDLFKGFPHSSRLTALHDSLSQSSAPSSASSRESLADGSTWHWGTWEENWAHTMWPLILRHTSSR